MIWIKDTMNGIKSIFIKDITEENVKIDINELLTMYIDNKELSFEQTKTGVREVYILSENGTYEFFVRGITVTKNRDEIEKELFKQMIIMSIMTISFFVAFGFIMYYYGAK